MSPAVVLALEYGLRYGPSIITVVWDVLHKEKVSREDILALKDQLHTSDWHLSQANLRAGLPAEAPLVFASEKNPPN